MLPDRSGLATDHLVPAAACGAMRGGGAGQIRGASRVPVRRVRRGAGRRDRDRAGGLGPMATILITILLIPFVALVLVITGVGLGD